MSVVRPVVRGEVVGVDILHSRSEAGLAGDVAFKSGDWHSSARAFRAMAAGVGSRLPHDEAGTHLREQLERAVDSRVYLLDCRSVGGGVLRHFLMALDQHVREAEEFEAAGLADEVMGVNGKGYLERLRSLREFLVSDIEGTVPAASNAPRLGNGHRDDTLG